MTGAKDIHLRVGKVDDAAGIAAVGALAFRSAFTNEANRAELDAYVTEEYRAEKITAHLLDPDTRILVADSAEGILGFVHLHPQQPDIETIEHYLMVERLYIQPELIGSGVGLKLWKAAVETAVSQGFDQLWLMVLRPNVRAISFYEKAGMEVFGRSVGKFKADAEIDLWMRLKLSSPGTSAAEMSK